MFNSWHRYYSETLTLELNFAHYRLSLLNLDVITLVMYNSLSICFIHLC